MMPVQVHTSSAARPPSVCLEIRVSVCRSPERADPSVRCCCCCCCCWETIEAVTAHTRINSGEMCCKREHGFTISSPNNQLLRSGLSFFTQTTSRLQQPLGDMNTVLKEDRDVTQ
ncbi:hypothetical protein QQF64_022742 [Cirrhinus molitorella]|uniref:Uncharacterized protein n=1 Tax=Cirrhinus molitorella TaxID=172907 RepID=A0ABR3L5H0_9TELE